MKTRYEQMVAELEKIAKPLNLNKSHFFEETLLRIADIKESPQKCRFEGEGDDCLFSFAISTAALNQFITYYSRVEFNGLNVIDVTEAYKNNPEKRRYTEIENTLTFVITMRIDALQKKVFPLIRNYLLKNPGIIERYDRQSYCSTRTLFDIENIFKEKKMSVNYFGEVFLGITRKHINTTFYLIGLHIKTDIFPAEFSLSLLSIVCSYLHLSIETLKTYTQKDIDELISYQGFLKCNPQDNHSLILHLKTPNRSAEIVADYFNRINPASATVFPSKEKSSLFCTDFKKINVSCKTLRQDILIEDLKDDDALASQHKSTLTFRTANCIKELENAQQFVANQLRHPLYPPLTKELSLLIKQLKNHGLESKEIKTQCDGIESNLKKIDALAKKSKSIKTTPFFQANLVNAEVYPDDIERILNGLFRTLRELKELSTRYHDLSASPQYVFRR
jgi:hypothetical protein